MPSRFRQGLYILYNARRVAFLGGGGGTWLQGVPGSGKGEVGYHNNGYKFRYGKLSTSSTEFSTPGDVEATAVPLKLELYGKPAIEVLSHAKAAVCLT